MVFSAGMSHIQLRMLRLDDCDLQIIHCIQEKSSTQFSVITSAKETSEDRFSKFFH